MYALAIVSDIAMLHDSPSELSRMLEEERQGKAAATKTSKIREEQSGRIDQGFCLIAVKKAAPACYIGPAQ